MPSITRRLLSLALAAAAWPALAADPYPTRPIRIIVNSAAGALLDVTTRTVAQPMSEFLKQPVVIDNRPGADGTIGIRAVKAAPADGYTILAMANTIAMLPAFKLDPGYDLVKDFTGIGMMNQAPLLLVTAPNLPYKSLPELIAAAKASPGKLSFASGGTGTTTHVFVELMLHQAGVNVVHVPYKGIAVALPDVMTGRVDFALDGGNSSGPHVRDGKLRALAITSGRRSSAFPEIPTIAEQGFAGYNSAVYLGLAAPAGTPPEAIDRLAQALRFALASDSVKDRFRRDGADAGALTPEEFTRRMHEDMQRTLKMAAELGWKKE